MKMNSATAMAFLLIAISIAVAIIMIVVSSSRDLTSLEATLFQVVSLAAGLSGSYIFGRSSAAESVRVATRLHARPAFRRAIDLYVSLSELSFRISQYRRQNPSRFHLAVVQALVIEQIEMGRTVLDDWHDLVPEDADEILEQQAGRLENDDTD